MPDQLRADALGCFGNAVSRTPNIDALATRGVRFTNAFCQHPVCGPSRVSLMTGWYPHVAGHRTLTHLLQPWEPNLLGIMRDAGYYVAVPGHRGDVFAPGVTEASSDFCGYLVAPEPGSLGNGAAIPDRLTRGFYFGSRGDERRGRLRRGDDPHRRAVARRRTTGATAVAHVDRARLPAPSVHRRGAVVLAPRSCARSATDPAVGRDRQTWIHGSAARRVRLGRPHARRSRRDRGHVLRDDEPGRLAVRSGRRRGGTRR